MSRALVDDICRSLPGAEWSDPADGGHASWKVGGKMFACIGVAGDGVSVKTPDIETAALMIEEGVAERAPYFHKSWVRIPWGFVEDAAFEARLLRLFAIVRATLPKKVQVTLG